MSSEVIVGIDLGTTNSAVGVVDSGFPLLLADGEGRRLMPSAVWHGEGGVLVGWEAKRRVALGGVETSVKRRMGVKEEAEEVSGEILRALKGVAEERLEQVVEKAVITVPAYFNESQRAATKRAGELAGLEVVRLLSEPTAAALAYGLGKMEEAKRVAVFDLGGGTFDVSILEMRAGQFEVLATAGDTRLGGDDLDGAIVAGVGIELSGLDEVARARVLEEGERVKCVLSEEEETMFRVPFLESGSVERKVRREEFEEWVRPFLEKAERCCRRAMADAGVKVEEVEGLVLAGGSTKSPVVREWAERIFGRAAEEGVDPDEAVGLGAAIQAGILSGAVREVVLLDVTPLSLGIETVGGLMNVLIPRNTTIPCKAGEMFTNAVAGQRAMKVRVLQGERELAKDNWELGEIEVPFEVAEKGQARVGIQFALDVDGLLEVLARDVTTGVDTVLTIESAAVDVEDAEVGRMVSESVEHAFEDMNARIFAEAKMKAEEMLESLGAARELLGEGGGGDELDEIEEAEAVVRVLLAGESPNGHELKQAVRRLDEATEGLAAQILLQAMG